MGDLGAADSRGFRECDDRDDLATRNRQWHSLRAQKRLPLETASQRSASLGHGVLLLPGLASGRDQALEALRRQMRHAQGRDEEPSAAVIDSQSIKTSAVRGSEKGYDAGKQIWGRKRHVLVDTEGNLMEVKVTGADDSDLAGGKKLGEPLQGRFPTMSLLWGDSHYRGKFLEWVKEHLGWEVQIVQRLGTARDASTTDPKPEIKASKGGFTVLPRRWVVERSIAWITRWRPLARDHEGLPQTSEAFIKISAFRRMLSHLAPAFP